MTLFGWIALSVFSIIALYFLIQLTNDILWNHQLRRFQKGVGDAVSKTPRTLFWVKRSYGAVVAGLFVLATVFSGTFSLPPILGDRILVNAKSLSNAEELQHMISLNQINNQGGWFATTDSFNEDMLEKANGDMDAIGAERDFIGTNNQVEGVEEADIVKTDGNMIYYASRYQNKIRILSIGVNGFATLEEDLDLGDVYTDSIFLTDQYLIVIGYIYDNSPYFYDAALVTGWRYPAYTGTVIAYDRDTLEIAYQLETDGNFYQYRLIKDEITGEEALFLISNKTLSGSDPRPTFNQKIGEEDEAVSHLDYSSIYYFDDVPVYGMTVFTGIDLANFNLSSKAFLGYVNQIYADEDNLYTTFTYYDYYRFTEAFEGYTTKTQILKFEMNIEDARLDYIAQGIVDGRIDNQYWMDEYQGYLRVVTTDWNPVKNQLFILKEKKDTDDLEIVGSITSGLGKPDETVYSVDFQGSIGYVVTFREIDPRYWIDLSNPTKPKILKETERPGVSTYLHIWNEEGNQVIGFGFMSDSNGRITGIELYAEDEELMSKKDTYQLPYQDSSGLWSYSYSEALYNPKALMISSTKGIFGFPIMSWAYSKNKSYYVSMYLVFYIDFTKENPDDILSDPIVITSDQSEHFFGIDRGVYISDEEEGFEMIYTLSNMGMISYNLKTKEIYQTIDFELPDWAK